MNKAKDRKDMTTNELIADYYGVDKVVESVEDIIQTLSWNLFITHEWENIDIDYEGKITETFETWNIQIDNQWLPITKGFAEYLNEKYGIEIKHKFQNKPKTFRVKYKEVWNREQTYVVSNREEVKDKIPTNAIDVEIEEIEN